MHIEHICLDSYKQQFFVSMFPDFEIIHDNDSDSCMDSLTYYFQTDQSTSTCNPWIFFAWIIFSHNLLVHDLDNCGMGLGTSA